MEIPKKVLQGITELATLGGVILGFDAIAQAAIKHEGVPLAIVGTFVSVVSGLSIYSDLLDWAGPDPVAHKWRRVGAGLMAAVLFAALAFTISLFRLKGE